MSAEVVEEGVRIKGIDGAGGQEVAKGLLLRLPVPISHDDVVLTCTRSPFHQRAAQALVQRVVIGGEVGVDDQQWALPWPVSLDGHDAVRERLRQRKGNELRRPVRHEGHPGVRLALSVRSNATWDEAPALGPESLTKSMDALGAELGLLEAEDVQVSVRRQVHDCPHASRHSAHVASAHPQQGVRHVARGPAPSPPSHR